MPQSAFPETTMHGRAALLLALALVAMTAADAAQRTHARHTDEQPVGAARDEDFVDGWTAAQAIAALEARIGPPPDDSDEPDVLDTPTGLFDRLMRMLGWHTDARAQACRGPPFRAILIGVWVSVAVLALWLHALWPRRRAEPIPECSEEEHAELLARLGGQANEMQLRRRNK
jgi:hypothetical protein